MVITGKSELLEWYRKHYITPNCYSLMDDPKIMRRSGIYFTLERPRNSQPMEPKRLMNKVRVWNSVQLNTFGEYKLD